MKAKTEVTPADVALDRLVYPFDITMSAHLRLLIYYHTR